MCSFSVAPARFLVLFYSFEVVEAVRALIVTDSLVTRAPHTHNRPFWHCILHSMPLFRIMKMRCDDDKIIRIMFVCFGFAHNFVSSTERDLDLNNFSCAQTCKVYIGRARALSDLAYTICSQIPSIIIVTAIVVVVVDDDVCCCFRWYRCCAPPFRFSGEM